MTQSLTETLFDLLGERRRECIARGWPEIPEWVFCSQVGTPLEPRNVARVWQRVRRRALKKKVRPLPMHSARHTWATLALQAGKNIRWVADQLGHADPAITIRVYAAHAMREHEADLSFAEFGVPGRPYTALAENDENQEEPKYAEYMARPVRFERTTLSSASLMSRAASRSVSSCPGLGSRLSALCSWCRYLPPAPASVRPQHHPLDDYPLAEIHDRVAQEVKAADIEFPDLVPLLEGRPGTSLRVYPTDHHPNEKVHAIVSEAIAHELLRANLGEPGRPDPSGSW